MFGYNYEFYIENILENTILAVSLKQAEIRNLNTKNSLLLVTELTSFWMSKFEITFKMTYHLTPLQF